MCIVEQITPQPNELRCRAVVTAALSVNYTVVVAAIPLDNGQPRMSNELQVTLPLEVRDIVLPPADRRVANTDLYKEYLEVNDGETDISSAGKCSICC